MEEIEKLIQKNIQDYKEKIEGCEFLLEDKKTLSAVDIKVIQAKQQAYSQASKDFESLMYLINDIDLYKPLFKEYEDTILSLHTNYKNNTNEYEYTFSLKDTNILCIWDSYNENGTHNLKGSFNFDLNKKDVKEIQKNGFTKDFLLNNKEVLHKIKGISGDHKLKRLEGFKNNEKNEEISI